MEKVNQTVYASPKADVIEVKLQSVIAASGPGTSEDIIEE